MSTKIQSTPPPLSDFHCLLHHEVNLTVFYVFLFLSAGFRAAYKLLTYLFSDVGTEDALVYVGGIYRVDPVDLGCFIGPHLNTLSN